MDGYHTYRIPAVISAKNGDLRAFCEGRKNSTRDTGDIDLLLKSSMDGRRTWGPQQLVWDDASNACGNPCPVLDESTGTLLLLLTHNIGTNHQREISNRTSEGTRIFWITHSTSHGAKWRQPTDISSAAKARSWTWYATGPGLGIRIQFGPHAGRLVILCDHGDTDASGENYVGGSHTLYPDDHGAMGPVCQGSILRHLSGMLLFSNPASKTRVKLTVRASHDEATSQHNVAVLHTGPSAYSNRVPLDTNSIGCLYENGEKQPYDKITFARIALSSH